VCSRARGCRTLRHTGCSRGGPAPDSNSSGTIASAVRDRGRTPHEAGSARVPTRTVAPMMAQVRRGHVSPGLARSAATVAMTGIGPRRGRSPSPSVQDPQEVSATLGPNRSKCLCSVGSGLSKANNLPRARKTVEPCDTRFRAYMMGLASGPFVGGGWCCYRGGFAVEVASASQGERA
jgi:hypothetical protein